MTNLRAAWGDGCPVIVSGAYKSDWLPKTEGSRKNKFNALFESTGYTAAKQENDVQAAIDICQRALNSGYLARVRTELRMLGDQGFENNPIVVAPSKPTSKNAIAKTAAEVLSEKLGIEFDQSITMLPTESRHYEEAKSKIFNRPKFTGEVQEGGLYILMDDMVTTGATLAELRSYIIENGGQVAFACSLASNDGADKELTPSLKTVNKVCQTFEKLGDAVQDLLEHHVGLTPDTLTQAEAEYLSSGKGEHAIRELMSKQSLDLSKP